MAERIRALEAKNVNSVLKRSRPTKPTTSVNQSKGRTFERVLPDPPGEPVVAPLRTKRGSTKTANLLPYRPETPIHRSIPDDDPYIHAPQPERSISGIVEPHEQAQHLLDTSRGNDDGFAISSGFGRRLAKHFAVRRTSRPHEDAGSPSVIHHRYRYQLGTITNCSRHGRRLPGTPHGTGATKDMVDRARSGEYIPIGMLHRSQLDATSPWAYLERAKVPVEDVCPDCAAEERLREAEAERTPMTPLQPTQALADRDDGVITAMKLPEAIGAIIILRTGVSSCIVTNVRQGTPTAANMRKLSEKLARVSQDMASLDRSAQSTASPEQGLKTLIFDTQAVKPKPSITELLHLTDQIASEMQLDIGQNKRAAAVIHHAREQSLLHSEDAQNLFNSPSPVLDASGPFCLRATPGPPSVYVTAAQSRKTSITDALASAKPDDNRLTLPSAMPQAANQSLSPATTPSKTVQQEAEASEMRSPAPPYVPSSSRVSPKSLPYPVATRPELRKSPRPQKRVRVTDLWPPKLRLSTGQAASPSQAVEQAQLEQHKARLDKNKAVQEAADIERQMRRQVRTRGGLGRMAGQKP